MVQTASVSVHIDAGRGNSIESGGRVSLIVSAIAVNGGHECLQFRIKGQEGATSPEFGMMALNSSPLEVTGPIVETPAGPMVLPTEKRSFVCPTCRERYYLSGAGSYLCTKDHVSTVLPNGRRRHLVVMERSEPERVPWAIPDVVEEKEAIQGDLIEAQLYTCSHPDNRTWMYGDLTKHLFGANHLTREEVLTKYAEYVLRPLGAQTSTQGGQPVVEHSPAGRPLDSASMADLRRKQLVVITALVVIVAVVVVAVLRLINLL